MKNKKVSYWTYSDLTGEFVGGGTVTRGAMPPFRDGCRHTFKEPPSNKHVFDPKAGKWIKAREQAKCSAKTKNGGECRNRALASKTVCRAHDGG